MDKTRKLITGIVAAFAGAALAVPAMAEVTVGGFMTQTVGFGDYKGGDESAESLHFDTNAEIIFTAIGQTDGGLTVTAQVELEGHSDGSDQIDENWLSISGDFGTLTLGGEDPAALTHGYVGIAGGYGIMGYYDDTDSFTPIGATMGPVSYRDAQGIRYGTPNFNGFSAGVSYQPDGADGPRSTGATTNDHAWTSVGASYTTDIGANMRFSAGAGYLSRDNDLDATPAVPAGDQWGAGIEFGLGSNTLFVRTDVRRNHGFLEDGEDATAWAVAYERTVGGTTAGIGYAKQTIPSSLIINSSRVEFEQEAIVAGVKQLLGGGVSAGAAIAWGEVDAEVSGAKDDIDGTAFGAFLAFNF